MKWQAQFLGVSALAVFHSVVHAHTSISVNETRLERSGSWVLVEWEGMTEPSAADAVALIMPPDADLGTTVPLKYKWANKSPEHEVSGSGHLRFRLINQRQPMAFKLFRNISRVGNFSQADVVATSPVISFASYNEPTQGHLAMTANPTEMKVHWTTRDVGFPEVRWGTSPGKHTTIAGGVSTTYTRQDMCGEPANGTGFVPPGYTHTATLTKLQPSRQYYYTYGDALLREFSSEHSFRTAPAVGSATTLHMLVNADMGHAEVDDSLEWEYDRNTRLVAPVGSPEGTFSSIVNVVGENGLEQGASLEVTRRMTQLASQTDLAWMNGDLSYARGFGTQWDVFLDQIEALATQVPTQVVLGNHEEDWIGIGDRFWDAAYDSGGECGVPTFQRFQMPGSGARKVWYSVEAGPVHFLQLDTELAFGAGSEQNNFVRADLQRVNRTRTPWVIVNGHRPMYPSSMFGQHHSSDLTVAQDLRSAFEELFLQHQVDVTFWGHTHLYERSCPVYQKTCVAPNADGSQRAPLHVILGNAGQWLTIFVNPNQPKWVDAMNIEHGFLKVAVNRTHLQAEMLAWSDGDVMDEWTLTKPEGWAPNPQEQERWMGRFQADPPGDFVDSIGVNQGIVDEIMAHLLDRVHLHLPEYHRVRNATLVRDLTKPDTLSNTLQALDPVLQELHAVSNWEALSPDAGMIAEQVLKPLFALLQQAANTSSHGQILNRGTLKGQCSALQAPQRVDQLLIAS